MSTTSQRINGIISPLVRNGQSLHQIYLNHVDDLMCSEKTLYNYVDAKLFDIRNIDLLIYKTGLWGYKRESRLAIYPSQMDRNLILTIVSRC